MTTNNLYETIGGQAYNLGLIKPEIPAYITQNLKHSFFDWQKEGLENFLTFQAIKEKQNKQNTHTHLMFNMATGTGKTLLMAATILYYYQQGYRHFLFFVNANNIVDKTENNFIENTHNKYLFTEKIVIDDQTVDIYKVGNFSDEPQGIEIKFTSIQKLYNDIHLEKENQTTLAALQDKNIVMLADEAHHLNANTKNVTIQEEIFEQKLSGSQAEKEKKGWEHTVIELILNKQGKKENKNVLLEFTATIPDDQNVQEKYADKIIYQFTLKEFLQAGFTKEINLISSTLDKKERVLQALVFQWYRHKIALKNSIANFKPVILFRSKTIEESKQDYQDFLGWIDILQANDFDFLNTIADKINEAKQPTSFEMGKSRTEQVLAFIRQEGINFIEIAEWIKINFKEKNTIITNSKTNKAKSEKTDEQTEKLLNSLEDKNNHIRAIFTVSRLNEGWDVLNLFDIVRLYEGRDEGKGTGGRRKTGAATVAEKQLIGRGVRYFPFVYEEKIKNKRKFDDDLSHESRVLEELYFYSTSDHRYIDELKRALKEDGYIRDDRTLKTFGLKEDFKQGNFYQNTKIWYNKQIDNPDRKKKNLDTIKNDFSFRYKIDELQLSEQKDILDDAENKQVLDIKASKQQTISKRFRDIDKHIVQKALHVKGKQAGSLFQFERLQKELAIDSIDDLRSKILADFEIEFIATTDFETIENQEKLQAVLQFLDKVSNELKEHITPKIGSEFIAGNFKKFFGTPKTKSIDEKNKEDSIANDNSWYVLDGFVGTSEEKELIKFIEESIGNLEKKYDEIYLLKNEEVYKIYNFEDGRGFAPDFLLFLKSKEKKAVGTVKTELYYQIFIEPKGDQFKDSEGGFKNSKERWKEEFLEQITQKYGFDKIIKAENQNYRLIGLPFFNKANNQQNFDKYYGELFTP